MFGWSLNLFRIRGIQLALHGSFFLLLAWIGYEGWQEGGWIGVMWFVGSLLAFFACVVLHELGHSFTAMHFGIGVRRILLMPIGGMAEFEAIPREPMREFLITLAGPAVNFAIVGVLALFFGLPAGFPMESEFLATAEGFAHLLLQANFIMGCFNLLPAFPMDGGRILRAILANRMPYLRATRTAATIGKIVCAGGIAYAIWQSQFLLAVLFVFIFFAGDAEYRAVRRREFDDARWREMLARIYGPGADTIDEPPMLSR
ncbi:site-2 protease family protein [Opitutus terrae]|uniref:Peptidase M50 n=1 Tax=Opitutus terrae (strain DSM 11246 / JCM 15787 / PB90-1) TaxID=452637 RepID=B1ZTC2_OPITP|nr:site-2 protease family protein [Opitutus terrae]ACB76576.1 peptidase M50 [Opitutus terrae PB90-1]